MFCSIPNTLPLRTSHLPYSDNPGGDPVSGEIFYNFFTYQLRLRISKIVGAFVINHRDFGNHELAIDIRVFTYDGYRRDEQTEIVDWLQAEWKDSPWIVGGGNGSMTN